jgi:hypothetical protein
MDGLALEEKKDSKMQLCAGSLVDRSRAFSGLAFSNVSSLSLRKVLSLRTSTGGVQMLNACLCFERKRELRKFVICSTILHCVCSLFPPECR